MKRKARVHANAVNIFQIYNSLEVCSCVYGQRKDWVTLFRRQ